AKICFLGQLQRNPETTLKPFTVLSFRIFSDHIFGPSVAGTGLFCTHLEVLSSNPGTFVQLLFYVNWKG
ncbi:MAG TPA: hypothetical protein PKY29_10700, partial [Ferruginibacter sp.]|nr:hypothetical protein [Ferruginibacter sp.]HRO18627.1 hypothetical protein [Ferruginibacter sp.]HRQ21778.1 hypothetical protein [Ferruginibacter sp.]